MIREKKAMLKIKYRLPELIILLVVLLGINGCKMFKEPLRVENRKVPASYRQSVDTTNSATIKWRNYFTDPNLVSLIDTALKNNQELNVTMQEINIARNEVKARKGEYLPNAGIQLGAGPDKAGKYTWDGQSEEDWKAKGDGPKYIGDFGVSAVFSWELDIWGKLRNAKRAAAARYLGSIEGKNFMVTNLVGEIANAYYELLALDNQLDIIQQNIQIQQNALNMTQQLKDNAKESQLAVNRFSAQLLNTQNRQYEIKQQITETENRINFLTARFPQPVVRNPASFNTMVFDSIHEGIPVQLLQNRPDIRQAEQEMVASKLDIKAAKAAFFPNVKLSASLGFQAFNPAVWFNPTSLLYSVFGDIMAPLINRNAVVAAYKTSRAKQIQSVYNYEKTVLNADIEVVNQLSGIDNYRKSYNTKASEVSILTQSITVSENLFRSARADYMEVLLTQREALETRMELIEIKKKQLNAEINIYKALGGGWR